METFFLEKNIKTALRTFVLMLFFSIFSLSGYPVSATVSSSGDTIPGGVSGSGSITKDICPRGDYTMSYYDDTCGDPESLSGATINIAKMRNAVTVTITTASGTLTNTFYIPGQVLKSLRDIKFNDISNNWAEGYIQKLVSRGLVDNTEKYNPNNGLTRAEFLKIIIDTAGWDITATGNITFKDVGDNSWYSPYVSIALSRGIISDRYRNFHPNNNISRAEAAKILVKTFGGDIKHKYIIFEDLDLYSDLTNYIETARILGFFSGQNEKQKRKFRPNDPITRAEAAKIISNAFKL